MKKLSVEITQLTKSLKTDFQLTFNLKMFINHSSCYIYYLLRNFSFDIVYQHTWDSPDPFYTRQTSGDFITAFKNYWNANFAYIPRDTAYLFTGNDISPPANGSIIAGVANVAEGQGAICSNPGSSYAAGRRVDVEFFDWRVFAHEVGHLLSARHTTGISGCSNDFMQSGASYFREDFCPYSINQITNYVNSNGFCLGRIESTKTKFDFDGDGKADISVFRPSEANWYIQQSQLGYSVVPYGTTGDKIAPADFDGDAKADVAVFRPSTNTWYILKSSTNTTTTISFGTSGDVPVPADYDGDARADVAIYRPSVGQWWYLRSRDGTSRTFQWGSATDKPVPDDFTGDGKADIAYWRPSDGSWYVLRSEDNSYYSFPFGVNGDIPTTADFDGDTKADSAIFRPSTGIWWILRSSGGTTAHQLGINGDIPVPADYDGDQLADIVVFRPSNGNWYFINTLTVSFGQNGDIPIPGFLAVQ